MTNIQNLAAEIADEVELFFGLEFPSIEYSQFMPDVKRIIAAKIEPLVEDAEKWKSECEAVRSLANKYELRSDDADRYEQWLLDIGRAIGCQHLDEQLPNCVIRHLQGDQESGEADE